MGLAQSPGTDVDPVGDVHVKRTELVRDLLYELSAEVLPGRIVGHDVDRFVVVDRG